MENVLFAVVTGGMFLAGSLLSIGQLVPAMLVALVAYGVARWLIVNYN